jgi:GAF domain-containing protein/HAMP domain-containing protein
MQKLRNWFTTLSPITRRVLFTVSFITLGFIVFSLMTIRDLFAPATLSEFIVNPIPIAISLLGIISIILVLRGKTRFSSYLLMVGVFIGFLIIAIFAANATYSTVAELLIVVIPIMIAIQSLSEREFTWIVVLTLVARSVIQILGTSKSSSFTSGLGSQTASIAEWASVIMAILFGLYVAINLNNFAFRVKMILVLGLLTIVPTAILTSISRNNLESNLINQANQSLVLSSDQLASAVDLYINTTLDTTRIEAQIPGFADYVGQSPISSASGDRIFARGTDLEKVTTNTLRALLKKDPLNILSVRLYDRQGTLQLSTNQSEIGKFEAGQEYFLYPFQKGLPYVSPVTILNNGTGIIHFSAPIRTSAGIANGVLDIVYSASILQQILVRNSDKLGPDVNAMLLDENNIILAHSSTPDLINKIINPQDNKTITNLIYKNRLQNLKPEQLSLKMDGLTPGLQNISKIQYFSGNFSPQQTQVTNGNSTPDQAGASELSSLNWYIVAFVPQTTLLSPAKQQTQAVVLISILISMISIAIALGLTQVLISPILSLTRTSERITQGDINATAMIKTQDEIGVLAATFNGMTGRVRDLIGGLEQRVAERTKDLERRAVQLQAAGDVGSTAARLRDLDELMRQVSRLISQRFGFYHVGIFLLDDRGDYAVLRASNSEGGQRMLSRGHKLKVGEVGIVGYVSGSGQPRIALNVGQDAEYFNNPDLPLTQSEMALPLIAGGKILGALDIQSTESAAFSEDDVTTLKVLADQIAVAIENARLFTEGQAALETARRAYGEMSQKGWQNLLHSRQANIGYVSLAEDRVASASEKNTPEFLQTLQSGQAVMAGQETILYVPIKVRGQSIGAIRMDKHQDGDRWTAEDVTMANSLAEQLGTALESARLYADISQRAQRESIISDIASKIGASIQIDTILRTSVEQLGRVLPDSEVSIQMGSQPKIGGENE